MGPVGYGALTTASALGGLVGIASFGWLEKRLSFAAIMRVCLSLEVFMHFAFALTTSPVVAFAIMFGFGAYAFVWGTISTTVRQRLVPLPLQGRIASVNMVGVFGGLVIGQALGGVIAEAWGLTAPWWFACQSSTAATNRGPSSSSRGTHGPAISPRAPRRKTSSSDTHSLSHTSSGSSATAGDPSMRAT